MRLGTLRRRRTPEAASGVTGPLRLDRRTKNLVRRLGPDDVAIIDQTKLPHAFAIVELRSVDDAWRAIADMQVRGAPLIGVAAAYGLALAMRADPSDANLVAAADRLATARPTAINLAWALDDARRVLAPIPPSQRAFVLGEFFDIWGQPLSSTQVLGFKADAQHSLQFFVDGQQYSGDPRQIPLAAHTLITIEYGPPFLPPPPFTFPPGL